MTEEAKTVSSAPPQQADKSSHQRLISLAPPPQLDGEDRAAYDALLKKLADAVAGCRARDDRYFPAIGALLDVAAMVAAQA
jgi:hypothetical protein